MKIVSKDYSNKNLQGLSFKGHHLAFANFENSDLRGTDFTGADLNDANLKHVKTGITPINKAIIFLVVLMISLLSGYIAMLGGYTLQKMLTSPDQTISDAGVATICIIVCFIVFSWWKGIKNALRNLIFPACLLAILISVINILSGFGTGEGLLYILLTFLLVGVMFIVGTVARAAAGSLSQIIFIIVGLSGGMFGRSIGGGIGAIIVAVSCAQISKRALSGAKGFDGLKMVAALITSKFGTSFRNASLNNTDFSKAELRNADFTNAHIVHVKWLDVKQKNCLTNSPITH